MPFSRPLDFGAGFYVTTFYHQAKRWAEKKTNRYNGNITVNKYYLNLSGLKVKEFKKPNNAWIDFVVSNRKTNEVLNHNYDVIIGEVANDQVFDSIQLYIDNIYTRSQLINALKTKIENNQLCLATTKALENLTFKGADLL